MSGSTNVVKCGSCGAKNRIDPSRISAAVCGRCKKSLKAAADGPLIVTDSNFGSTVDAAELPVLLDLWAEWCGPCRLIAPVIEKLSEELAGKALVGKLDVDRNPLTASRFGVQSIPTLLILKEGKEVDRLIGLQSREAILNRLSRFI
ncbi:MAG: thioredoxin [Aridibacter famidurans]|nr:thioredoxin [Aridibacter famidurans]